jgi:hypothetical protein
MVERRERRRVWQQPARWCGECPLLTGENLERVAIASEELFQILPALGIVFDRRAGRDDAKLRRIRLESDSMQECPKQVADLGSRRAAVGVQFVYDQMKYMILPIGLQPVLSLFKNSRF